MSSYYWDKKNQIVQEYVTEGVKRQINHDSKSKNWKGLMKKITACEKHKSKWRYISQVDKNDGYFFCNSCQIYHLAPIKN